jgi:hypothetical protein
LSLLNPYDESRAVLALISRYNMSSNNLAAVEDHGLFDRQLEGSDILGHVHPKTIDVKTIGRVKLVPFDRA